MSVGQPLAEALESLRTQGLQIIFSSALIEPAFKVRTAPGEGSPEELARRLLAPYNLTLEAIRPNIFSVVRATPVVADAQAADAALPLAAGEPSAVVSVYASRYAIDAQGTRKAVQFSREELNSLPGIDEDVLRVARYLPGNASNALSARSHVRGGRDNETAVYFDDVPLFEPFHFKDVQSLLGMLEPQTISTVDFYSGVFPARYGNRISGVLDIQPREWSGDDYNAIGASLLYTHALSQGRMSDWPLEWLASVRRGNVDLLADALGREDTSPNFLDALGRVQLTPREGQSLAAGWLLLDDGLQADVDDERGRINYRDSTTWLSWHRAPDGDGLALKGVLSRTERHTWRDGSVARSGSVSGTVHDRRIFNTSTARLEGSMRESPHVRLTGGLEWYGYDAHYQYASEMQFEPQLAAAFGKPAQLQRATELRVDGDAFGAYASALLNVTPRMLLDVGARWDGQRFGSFNGDQVSPRLSLQLEPDPTSTLRLSWGRFAQTERPDELAVQDGDPTFHTAQRAEQLVLSLERRPKSTLSLRFEAYEKHVSNPPPEYENLLDPFALLPELAVDRVRVDPDRSHAYGAESSLRWEPAPPWLTWVSYSYSQVRDDFGSQRVPRSWDQRHSLIAGVNWSHGPWGLSANGSWHSGWRRNLLELNAANEIELAARNSHAWHDYLSMDVRGTWSRAISSGALQVFLEADNVTNHDNPCCADYRAASSPEGLELTHDRSTWLPRIYLLGITWQLP